MDEPEFGSELSSRFDTAALRQREEALTELVDAVVAINHHFIDLLSDCASSSHRPFPLPGDVRAQLIGLTLAERHTLANSRVLLVDGGFAKPMQWSPDQSGSQHVRPTPWLPFHLAQFLAHDIWLLARYALRMSPTMASVLFGMSDAGAFEFGRLTVSDLSELARLDPHRIRPRWECHPRVWLSLIKLAREPGPAAIDAVTLRCLQAGGEFIE